MFSVLLLKMWGKHQQVWRHELSWLTWNRKSYHRLPPTPSDLECGGIPRTSSFARSGGRVTTGPTATASMDPKPKTVSWTWCGEKWRNVMASTGFWHCSVWPVELDPESEPTWTSAYGMSIHIVSSWIKSFGRMTQAKLSCRTTMRCWPYHICINPPMPYWSWKMTTCRKSASNCWELTRCPSRTSTRSSRTSWPRCCNQPTTATTNPVGSVLCIAILVRRDAVCARLFLLTLQTYYNKLITRTFAKRSVCTEQTWVTNSTFSNPMINSNFPSCDAFSHRVMLYRTKVILTLAPMKGTHENSLSCVSGRMLEHLVAHPEFKLLTVRNIPQMSENSRHFSSYQWHGLLKHLRQMLIANTPMEEGENNLISKSIQLRSQPATNLFNRLFARMFAFCVPLPPSAVFLMSLSLRELWPPERWDAPIQLTFPSFLFAWPRFQVFRFPFQELTGKWKRMQVTSASTIPWPTCWSCAARNYTRLTLARFPSRPCTQTGCRRGARSRPGLTRGPPTSTKNQPCCWATASPRSSPWIASLPRPGPCLRPEPSCISIWSTGWARKTLLIVLLVWNK